MEAALEASGAQVVLFSSSNHTKDVAARLAIRADGGVITDCTNLEVADGQITATKEVFGGDMITQSKVAEGKLALFGVAANAFPAEESGDGAAEVGRKECLGVVGEVTDSDEGVTLAATHSLVKVETGVRVHGPDA
jgi:electron transfer flavoprotein alpha subunit